MFARISGGMGVVQLSPSVVGSNLIVVIKGDVILEFGNVIDNVLFNLGFEPLDILILDRECLVAVVLGGDTTPEKKIRNYLTSFGRQFNHYFSKSR